MISKAVRQITTFIDAVENDSDTDMAAEERRPPGKDFHMNYFQEGGLMDAGLDGGPIKDPPGAEVEENVDDPEETHTHFTIDDDPDILDVIENSLTD